MIILRFCGGIGNQLFQMAAATSLSLSTKKPILLNTKAIINYKNPRKFLLDKILNLDDFPLYRNHSLSMKLLLHISSFRIGRFSHPFCVNDLNARDRFSYPSKRIPCIFLDGYFQNCWHLLDSTRILNLFKNRLILDKSFPTDSLNHAVIHIRGSDFLDSVNHNICNLDFYSNAVKKVSKEGFKDFVIITDDQAYALAFADRLSQLFPSLSFFISKSRSELEDFASIMRAPIRIIGNSTFAYWACMLSPSNTPFFSSQSLSTKIQKQIRLSNETWITANLRQE